MSKHRQQEKFLQTYVYTDKYGDFFVSTCYRRSSARLNPDQWYFETFAWRLENKKRTEWVADNSGGIYEETAHKQHIEVCRQLQEKGKYKEVEDE